MKHYPLLLVMFLAGCDNPITCKDPCSDKKETRDFFCRCFDPEKNKSSSNNAPAPTGNSAFSQCVCQYSSGQVGAWFNYKPSVYNQFGDLEISASSCSDLTVCERTEHGSGGYSYTFLTGKMKFKPSTWHQVDNFITGGSSWYVMGKVESKVSHRDNGGFSSAGPRFALNIKRWLRALEPAAFDNTVTNCAVACKVGSPFCLAKELSGPEAQGIKKLYNVLNTKPSAIKADALMAMFNVSADPCQRSDTDLAGGKLENTGDACTLDSAIPALNMTASIEIPTNLYGDLEIGADGTVSLELRDSDRRPRLSFSDAFVNADWGGEIKRVFGTGSSIGFGVGDESCVLMTLK